MDNDRYWIIGHKSDFDFIIIGENTGPYSDFPEYEYSRAVGGTFIYVKNFVASQFGHKLVVTEGPAFSKCPCLDELNKDSISGGPFEKFEDVFLQPLFREKIIAESVKRHLNLIPFDYFRNIH